MVTSRRTGTQSVLAGSSALAALIGLLALAPAGCQPSGGAAPAATAKPVPPAKVEGAPKEGDLATVTLTGDAETHLGLVTADVVKKPVPRTTTYAGEVTIPSGRLTAVTPLSAPLRGTQP